MRPLHSESHLVERIGWLRAAVLGANDGLSRPISRERGGSFRKIQSSRKRNWRKSMLLVAWNLDWRGRSRSSLWPRMH